MDEKILCGWCNKPNDIGDWCSNLCFENWHRARVDKPPAFSSATVFYTGPLRPHTMNWLTASAPHYGTWG